MGGEGGCFYFRLGAHCLNTHQSPILKSRHNFCPTAVIFSYTRLFVFAAYRFWKNSKDTVRFAGQSLVRKGESSY